MSTIIVADDHPLYRDAVKDVIEGYIEHDRLLQAGSLEQVFQQLSVHPDTDLVLLDLNMPGMNGLAGLSALRTRYPATAVAMMSAHDEKATVLDAIQRGAAGYISKSLERKALAHALQQLLKGEMYLPAASFTHSAATTTSPASESTQRELQRAQQCLTERQYEVFLMLAEGASNKAIAERLHVAETTVKTHVSAILEKLALENRMQAGLLASRLLAQIRTE
ncbi:response regulator [Aliidiomarina celeris]|uniref:response regulator n=1 Tax=Aliidiomarina celeris TaxID=2249428 RepID=UPI000DEACAF7|nr:response regulator transcription factor [Aliidiomarina celeris]